MKNIIFYVCMTTLLFTSCEKTGLDPFECPKHHMIFRLWIFSQNPSQVLFLNENLRQTMITLCSYKLYEEQVWMPLLLLARTIQFLRLAA